MKFTDLLEQLDNVTSHTSEQNEDVLNSPIKGVTSDSRKIEDRMIFVALHGSRTDGHQYLKQAADDGALALFVQKSRLDKAELPEGCSIFVCENTYKTLAHIASLLQDEPGKKMNMVGVTGTNGKTTVTHLIEQILLDNQKPVALLGTLGVRQSNTTRDNYQTTAHTTPMAVELQEILTNFHKNGSEYVVMEVSSHALDQYRVYGCDFNVAVHTNVTQDHLDFHKTMDEYCRAKTLLFSNLIPTHNPAAVINLDDNYADKFLEACPDGVQLLTYGIESKEARVHATNLQYNITGASFDITTPVGDAQVTLKLAGEFSVYNALAAIASGIALNIPLEQCVTSVSKVPGVRGRFEVVAEKPYVIVDYAHTPDGLENVLQAARQVTPEDARLICVFGCGGDRDATKRPKMGHIAERLADVLVVTSDNPRTEDPQQILTDILSGIKRYDAQNMLVNVDRKQAIHQAIDLANENDIIVVAGKGHEDYQILATETIHFDDREVVQDYVQTRKETVTS